MTHCEACYDLGAECECDRHSKTPSTTSKPVEAKRYEIEKISDIFQIPEDRFHLFVDDLLSFYSIGKNMSKLIETTGKVLNTPVQALPQKMTWIDDDKHEVKIALQTNNKEEEV